MIKPFGKGCTIIDCDVDLNLPENEKILDEIISNPKKIRGEIISNSLEVEFILNTIIGLFFIGNNKEQKNIFDECILHKEFFTFSEKVKTLDFLLTNYPKKFRLDSDKTRKKIISSMRYVMERRNKFAHEEFIVNFNERTVRLLDKKQQDQLSVESINKFQQHLTFLSLAFMMLLTNLSIEIMKEKKQ